MNCPKDGTQLEPVRLRNIELDKCHRCDGLWFDHGELERVRAMNASNLESQIEAEYGSPEIEPSVPTGYMRCPRCQGRLQRRHFVGHAAVIVDICESCRGIWLDDGELDLATERKRTVEQQVESGRVTAFLRSIARVLSPA